MILRVLLKFVSLQRAKTGFFWSCLCNDGTGFFWSCLCNDGRNDRFFGRAKATTGRDFFGRAYATTGRDFYVVLSKAFGVIAPPLRGYLRPKNSLNGYF